MLPTQLFVTPTSAMTSSRSHQDLADFASSMVYLMWHARKTTKALVSERSYSPSLVGNDLAYLMWQSRKPMTKAQHYSPLGGDHSFSYTASPAFKKFCYQVVILDLPFYQDGLLTFFFFLDRCLRLLNCRNLLYTSL